MAFVGKGFEVNALIIGLTIANAVLFLGTVVFFLANLKLYTEILKAKDQRGRKGG